MKKSKLVAGISAAAILGLGAGFMTAPVGDASAAPGALGDLPAPSSKKYTPVGSAKKSKGRSSVVVSKYPDEGDYASVAAAVRAVGSGGTVFVYPGAYRESVKIDKSVNLRGMRDVQLPDDRGARIIAPVNQPCLTFAPKDKESQASVTNVTFDASDILNAGAACVEVRQGVFSLEHSTVDGGGLKIADLIQVNNGIARIVNNTIRGGAKGILVAGQPYPRAKTVLGENRISGNTVGVDINFRANEDRSISDVIVTGNDISNNLTYGIINRGAAGVKIVGNTVTRNGPIKTSTRRSSRDKIDNTSKAAGIYLAAFSDNDMLKLENNVISGNSRYGLFIDHKAGSSPYMMPRGVAMANNEIRCNGADVFEEEAHIAKVFNFQQNRNYYNGSSFKKKYCVDGQRSRRRVLGVF
ncbi:MAG: right-handed parallel beta-helix repeat-containing protein [Pseudomonadota bacterium]